MLQIGNEIIFYYSVIQTRYSKKYKKDIFIVTCKSIHVLVVNPKFFMVTFGCLGYLTIALFHQDTFAN